MKAKNNNSGRYVISTDKTDNPKLCSRVLSNGKESLYLQYYTGYTLEGGKVKAERHKETLNLYLWSSPRTPQEREQNKETLDLAKKIRFERGQQMLEDKTGYRLKKKQEVNFISYFQSYIEGYTKKDIKMLRMALSRFISFLQETPAFQKYSKSIKPSQVTRDLVQAFVEYLQEHGKGEGPKSTYQRFKKVINHAIEHDVMTKNPCKGITITIDTQILRKDVLSMEEIKSLLQTPYPEQNQDTRRAFIFCLYTGLRYCDVRALTFANIDYSNGLLSFEQNKTKGHSANSGVIVPLNETTLKLIGLPSDTDRDSLIFHLPTLEGCNKTLQKWVDKAGITKHITWHCARHSFAVNILNNGANIKTLASLLGHSGLKHTEKYTRAIDSLKQDAINSLPQFM